MKFRQIRSPSDVQSYFILFLFFFFYGFSRLLNSCSGQTTIYIFFLFLTTYIVFARFLCVKSCVFLETAPRRRFCGEIFRLVFIYWCVCKTKLVSHFCGNYFDAYFTALVFRFLPCTRIHTIQYRYTDFVVTKTRKKVKRSRRWIGSRLWASHWFKKNYDSVRAQWVKYSTKWNVETFVMFKLRSFQ